MTIQEFQKQIEAVYLEKDSARGLDGTFRWFVEEVGELAKAIRNIQKDETAHGSNQKHRANLEEEFSDVLAWLSTLASLTGVDLEKVAVAQYGSGCPKCEATPCACAAE